MILNDFDFGANEQFSWTNDNPEVSSYYMPDFCDGPKGCGVARICTQNRPLVRYYDGNEDFFMQDSDDLFDIRNNFEHALFLKDDLDETFIKPIKIAPSYQFENKPKDNNFPTISEIPKSTQSFSNYDIKENYQKSEKQQASEARQPVERNAPSQSSRTITQSFTEDLNTVNNFNQGQGKRRLKRGATTKYILERSPEEIVNNTLSGLLVKFLRENGPQPLEILSKLVTSEYPNLRKLSGHTYNGNVAKALKGALTANGLFEPIEAASSEFNKSEANRSDRSACQRQDTVWKVIEEMAERYIEEKVNQVKAQRNSIINKQTLRADMKAKSQAKQNEKKESLATDNMTDTNTFR